MVRYESDCPFCLEISQLPDHSKGHGGAFILPDAFPVASGHLLVVPGRHVARVEELSSDEWSDLFALVREVVREAVLEDHCDGVNIGVNSGVAAGQTVAHAHVHVIPRTSGDCLNPRGGVRRVIEVAST